MSAGVHGSVVLIGERGVLLRGASGTGKSLLALALIDRARRDGGFAALIADDRVWLDAVNGRLLARGAPKLAGLCERRADGLIEAPHEARAVLKLIVDLAGRNAPPPRMPAPEDRHETLRGVALPRLALDLSPGLGHGVSAILSALQRTDGTHWRKNVYDDAVFA